MREELLEESSPSSPIKYILLEAKPIRSTRLRRALTICAARLATRCGQSIGWSIVCLSRSICVKCGPLIDLNEAVSMQVVRELTTVPVPKIYFAFSRRGITYIVMEYIRGETLWSYWQGIEEETKENLRSQSKEIMAELREVQQPVSGQVEAPNGGKICDNRYTERAERSFGPLATVQDFHLWLRRGISLPLKESPDNAIERSADIEEMIRLQDCRDYSAVVTHGDLSSSNIIVKNDRIVGIIDWESAAWYPDYWELTSAWNVNHTDEFWRPEIEKILDFERFRHEHRMEQIRRKCFQSP